MFHLNKYNIPLKIVLTRSQNLYSQMELPKQRAAFFRTRQIFAEINGVFILTSEGRGESICEDFLGRKSDNAGGLSLLQGGQRSSMGIRPQRYRPFHWILGSAGNPGTKEHPGPSRRKRHNFAPSGATGHCGHSRQKEAKAISRNAAWNVETSTQETGPQSGIPT